jgi:Methyltransferase small domain
MMSEPSAYSVNTADALGLQASLARLAAVGYTEANVRARLGLADINDVQLRAIPIYLKERLAEGQPLDVAITLFLLQGCVPVEALSPVLAPELQADLARLGVLSMDGAGRARAAVSLYPVGQRLFFADHAWPQLSPAGSDAAPFDPVMFVGADSRWLARATLRRPVAQALDLCTGSGIQALLAAAHARRVVAVDINPRAVRCAQFNARASGCDYLDVLEGDLYGPIGAERFELITANPPFVPSPVAALGFRDGGRSGEDIQRRIVAGLPAYLAPGGMAQIVTEVGERDGEPLVDRVRAWLGDAPLDIHLTRLRIHPASAYALGHASGDTPEAFLASVEAWADNLRAQGYRRVVSVLLAFQWSDPAFGPSWSRVDDAYPPQRDAGPEIEAAFAAERLSRAPDLNARLAAAWVARAGPVMLREAQVLGSPAQATCQAVLSGQALPVEYGLDVLERDLLTVLDQPVAVAALLKLAAQTGLDAPALYAGLGGLLRKRLITLVGGI